MLEGLRGFVVDEGRCHVLRVLSQRKRQELSVLQVHAIAMPVLRIPSGISSYVPRTDILSMGPDLLLSEARNKFLFVPSVSFLRAVDLHVKTVEFVVIVPVCSMALVGLFHLGRRVIYQQVLLKEGLLSVGYYWNLS